MTRLTGNRWFALAAAGAIALVSQGAVAATRYNAVGNFSIKSNPIGPWSYLETATLLAEKTDSFGGTKRWIAWINGGSVPNSYAIARNKTGSTITYLTIVAPTDHLLMDPESSPSLIVRFTAPAAGTYHVRGDFLGIDSNEQSHPVAINRNGTTIYKNTVSAFGQSDPFDLKMPLTLGETVDFVCGTGSTYTYLSTGLAATVIRQ